MTWGDRIILALVPLCIAAAIAILPPIPAAPQRVDRPTSITADDNPAAWTWTRTERRIGSLVLWVGRRPGSDVAVYRALPPGERPDSASSLSNGDPIHDR